MASKQRVSLRRKQKVRTDGKRVTEINENEDDADDFEMKSPSRQVKDDTSPSKEIPPGFRSPVQTASSNSRRKSSPGSGDTSLDDSSEVPCSQVPTPSKWSYLLPDFNSQPDGFVSEVLWDCSSPDAVKYLRRVQKDNSNIKELIKFVKEPSADGRSQSPPIQLQFLRASLQKHLLKKKKPPNAEKRKARKLAQKRKQKQKDKERERQLFGQMVSAVAKRKEMEAKLREEKQSGASTSKLDTVATSNEAEEEEDEEEEEEEWEDDEGWEDDDLFENNAFIIAATQNPYEFLQENASKTSTPVLAAAQQREACEPENHDGSGCADDKNSMEDSQSPEVIPPTYVTRRSSKVSTKPRVLFGESAPKEKGRDDKTVTGLGNNKTTVGLQKKDRECSSLSASAEKMKPPNSSKQLPSLKSATKDVGKKAGPNQVRTISQASQVSELSSARSVKTNAVSSRDTLSDGVMSDEVFLKMPALGYTSQSQVIQEFPTQATTKLCDRATLKSVKSGSGSNSSSHREDFPDEIDFETLASICETDSSFSDSPIRQVKTNSKTVVSDRNEIRSPGHSGSKQPKLQEGAKTTNVTTPAHSSANWGKTTNVRGSSAASSGLVFPPFAKHPQENSRPLSSLAMGNTVTEKRAAQSGRKFTFKPVSSSSSSASSGQMSPSDSNTKLGAVSAINKPSTSAGMSAASSLDVSCSQLKLNNDAESDDMMEDDPLYESQIMAILDQVESQATQHMVSIQGCCSQERSSSPPRCSQEEIEKKRQAAMQRRLRSKTRPK